LPEELPKELFEPEEPPKPLLLLRAPLGALVPLLPPQGLDEDFALPLEPPQALLDEDFWAPNPPEDLDLAPNPVAVLLALAASRFSNALAAPLLDESVFPVLALPWLLNLEGLRDAEADLNPAEGCERLTGLTFMEVR
jgi:hypothetical protein